MRHINYTKPLSSNQRGLANLSLVNVLSKRQYFIKDRVLSASLVCKELHASLVTQGQNYYRISLHKYLDLKARGVAVE